MRVLHLPANIASQISMTTRALRDIGVDAHGLVVGNAIVQDATGVRNFSLVSRKKLLRWAISKAYLFYVTLLEISRSDVVHWHFAQPALPGAIDLKWAQWLGKPGIVEFWGSDIRIPEEEARDNPYYARLGPDYEYRSMESRALSYMRQERFASHGVRACFASQPFDRYLKPGLFQRVYRNRGRVILSDFQPSYPSLTKSRPVLAHSPTAKVGKGTSAVIATVDILKQRYDFDFQLIHGITRSQALEVLRACDLFLDQFVDGTSYGLSAVEAMAFGKPVVCYIKPSAAPSFPDEMPIINANQDNLVEVLEPLLQNAQLRHDIGILSRAYVEKHHNAHKYAQWLVSIYRELIDDKGQ